ncbi:MAG: dipeptidase [Cryobacterium sp.]|nr:dipeptidase [Cryobacterium sp.]
MTPVEVPASSAAALEELVAEGLPKAISDLGSLVRIPSVSWAAFDPAHVQASAEAVAELARGLGIFDSIQISRAAIADTEELGQPAVLGVRAAKNGRPTVLLYAHHDVQPPGKDEEWESAPFEPVVRGARLYGRGAADDKAGVMTHIASLRAISKLLGEDLDLGIVLFIEGEEEFGSRSFRGFIEKHRQELASDVMIVADSDNWSTEVPAITVSLRGNVTFRLSVRTLGHASHSGMFGGAVPDAMLAMVKLLSTLHNDNGGVAVKGLTSTSGQTPEFDEERLRQDAAILDGISSIGTGTVPSRLWYQPSITVTGIDAPTVANASNTLIPEVSVRVSARIAPGQKAEDAFRAIEAHLNENKPFGAHIAITEADMGEPFLVDRSGWAIAECKAAMAAGWGQEPVETGVGGSIPFISDLVEAFPAAQVLVTGVEDPDTRAHSPNESLHLGVFRRAIQTEANLLWRLNQRH